MNLHRRLQRFLRASLLTLLVLGLLAKPVVLFMCEVHSIEHARIAAADPHGIHFEGDRDDPGDNGQSGSKHTHGANGVWQLSVATFASVVPDLTAGIVLMPRVALPPLRATAIEPRAPTNPFRPPIA